MPILLALWTADYEVHGVRKMLKAMVRNARLMAQLGIRGVRKGKKPKTTKSDPAAVRPPDLVDRQFVTARPNALG
jgi:putative transposase